MHAIELLEEAVRTAESLGYQVRREWLGGCGGGPCQLGGKRLIFLDSSLNVLEQLEQIATSLREDPAIHLPSLTLSPPIAQLLQIRRVA